VITIQDLQTSIAKVLTDNGNIVTANEIQEGFQKPTFFIDLFTNSTQIQNQYTVLVNVGVELKYIPSVETNEECILKSEQIKNMFLNSPIAVGDRFLTVNDITFDIENNNLTAYFELEFLQERNISLQEDEKIQNIEIGGLDSYGTPPSHN